jgi:hypothetical protein
MLKQDHKQLWQGAHTGRKQFFIFFVIRELILFCV